jgi:hypothetical protein
MSPNLSCSDIDLTPPRLNAREIRPDESFAGVKALFFIFFRDNLYSGLTYHDEDAPVPALQFDVIRKT